MTRAQLASLGITSTEVTRHIRAGRWVDVSRKVVVAHNGPHSPMTTSWIAALTASKPAALGAWSGLVLHGLRGWEQPGVHLIVAKGARPTQLPNVTVHQSRRFTDQDIVLIRGLPERCAIDAAAWQLSPFVAVGLLADVVWQGITTPALLTHELGKAGSIRFRSLMKATAADLAGGAGALRGVDLKALCRIYDLPQPEQAGRHQDSEGRTRYYTATWTLPSGAALTMEIDAMGHMETPGWYDGLLSQADLSATNRDHRDDVRIRLPATAVRLDPIHIVTILAAHLIEDHGWGRP